MAAAHAAQEGVLLDPDLLCLILSYTNVNTALQTGTCCKALHDIITSPSGAYFWHEQYLHRWLFCPRKRSLVAIGRRQSVGLQDYKQRHLTCGNLQQGRAGQYKVTTIRPKHLASGSFSCCVNLQSGMESDHGLSGEASGQAGVGEEDWGGMVAGDEGGGVQLCTYCTDGGTSSTALVCVWRSTVLAPSAVTAVHVQGQMVAAGSSNGRVALLNGGTGDAASSCGVVDGAGGAGPVTSILVVEDGGAVAVMGQGGIRVIDAATGAVRQTIDDGGGGSARLMGAGGDGARRCIARQRGQRSWFVVIDTRRVRLFVQDPPSPSAAVGRELYSEHSRVVPAHGHPALTHAVVVGSNEGWRHVVIGDASGAAWLASLVVRPRVHIAHAVAGGAGVDPRALEVPLHLLHRPDHGSACTAITTAPRPRLQPRPLHHHADAPAVPGDDSVADHMYTDTSSAVLRGRQGSGGGAAATASCLVAMGHANGGATVLSVGPLSRNAAAVGPPCHVMMRCALEHRGAVTCLVLDPFKLLTASADNSIKVWPLVQSPNASDLSAAEVTTPSLYTLLGGSVSLNGGAAGAQALAFSDTEIVACFGDKLRVYDFSYHA